VFTVTGGEQIVLAAVSDPQWETFCDALGFADLKADASLATNNLRVQKRPWLLATLGERLAKHSADELADIFERAGLPFAPINRPEDLFDDPHLAATGGLADVKLPDGQHAGQSVRRRCSRSPSRDSASACASIRHGWASTRATSCASLVTTLPRSTR